MVGLAWRSTLRRRKQWSVAADTATLPKGSCDGRVRELGTRRGVRHASLLLHTAETAQTRIGQRLRGECSSAPLAVCDHVLGVAPDAPKLFYATGAHHLTRHKISCREPNVHKSQHTLTTAAVGSVNRRLARGQLHRLVRHLASIPEEPPHRRSHGPDKTQPRRSRCQ
jgi:hypothetical protein